MRLSSTIATVGFLCMAKSRALDEFNTPSLCLSAFFSILYEKFAPQQLTGLQYTVSVFLVVIGYFFPGKSRKYPKLIPVYQA